MATTQNPAAGANLPALPNVIAAQRMVSDIVRLAARVDGDKNRDRAFKRMEKRLVMRSDGKSPQIIPVIFGGEDVMNWVDVLDDEGQPVMHRGRIKQEKVAVDVKIHTRIHLQGIGEVDALPLISHTVAYIQQDEGGEYRSIGTFYCLAFEPRRENDAYKVVPLGLAEESTLRMWNRIAGDPSSKSNWPVIDQVPSLLYDPKGRFKVFCPEFLREIKVGPKRNKRSTGEWFMGYEFGQKLCLRKGTPTPPTDKDDDGNPCFTDDHVFRVRLRENTLELTHVCRASELDVNDLRLPIVELEAQMDGFAVLGLSVHTANPSRIDGYAQQLAQGNLDERNPLYRAALQMGLVFEEEDAHVARPHLDKLAERACRKVREELDAQYRKLKSLLAGATGKPSIEKMLQGRTLRNALKSLNQPEDVTAKWIEKSLSGDFDPKSRFHRGLRKYVLNSTAKAAGYTDPKKEQKAKESDASEGADAGKPNGKAEAKEAGGTNGAGKAKAPAKKPAAKKAPAKKAAAKKAPAKKRAAPRKRKAPAKKSAPPA